MIKNNAVSCNFIYSKNLLTWKGTWRILYPNADTTPVMVPMRKAPPGWSMRSAIAPTATPPLKVAF